MTKGFDTDDAKWVLQRTDDWVRSADAKAGAVAAIIAGVTAVTLTNDNLLEAAVLAFKDSSANIAEFALIIIAIASALGSSVSLLISLNPRTKNPRPSLIFFGDIAKEKDGESLMKSVSDEEYRFDIDVANQIIVNSKICSKKMKWNKGAGILAAVFVLSLAAFSVLSAR